MASLTFDRQHQTYYLRFRFRGRQFRRSLGTLRIKHAQAMLARVEETLLLIEAGRISVPPDADPAVFILSDGRQKNDEQTPLLTLGELVRLYQSQRLPGVKEPSTVRTEDMHLRHLLRHLKQTTFVQGISSFDLQNYIAKRLREPGRSGTLSTDTVQKELATLRVVWNWALRHGLVSRTAPIAGLEYPKRDQRQPFRTWDEIMAILARGGLSKVEERELWEALYLTRDQVQDVLSFVDREAKHEFIYPLMVFVAHTGARISEALRSRLEDIDLTGRKITIREKKRSRIRATTFRQVDMTPLLAEALKAWLPNHPGGLHTFTKEDDLNPGRGTGQPVPINKHVARKHFKLTFRGSKWAKLRGYHVFRHSFASNLAAAGVDQRIIDEWMGHQTDEMRARYRHLLPDVRRAAILKIMPGA